MSGAAIVAAYFIVNSTAAAVDIPEVPATVAGISVPQTKMARSAIALAARTMPPFLFNHCMRTFVFGALQLEAEKKAYDPELAFVAAALHDLGLMPSVASAHRSFEIDGANAAEKFAAEEGRSVADQRTVWNAVAMHDMNGAFASHQSPEALLVAMGAGSDVVGYDSSSIDGKKLQAILAAFPRLQFKTNFTALLVDHCKRKPGSESGWLYELCRNGAAVKPGSVQEAITSAPFDQ